MQVNTPVQVEMLPPGRILIGLATIFKLLPLQPSRFAVSRVNCNIFS